MLRLLAIWQFYKTFAPVSWLLTFLCVQLLYAAGTETWSTCILLKLFSYFFIYIIVRYNWRKEMFFYYNLHLPAALLWLACFLADFLLFTLCMLIATRL